MHFGKGPGAHSGISVVQVSHAEEKPTSFCVLAEDMPVQNRTVIYML